MSPPSVDHIERLILVLLNGEPLSEEDRREIVLELVARRRTLLQAAPRDSVSPSATPGWHLPPGG